MGKQAEKALDSLWWICHQSKALYKNVQPMNINTAIKMRMVCTQTFTIHQQQTTIVHHSCQESKSAFLSLSVWGRSQIALHVFYKVVRGPWVCVFRYGVSGWDRLLRIRPPDIHQKRWTHSQVRQPPTYPMASKPFEPRKPVKCWQQLKSYEYHKVNSQKPQPTIRSSWSVIHVFVVYLPYTKHKTKP